MRNHGIYGRFKLDGRVLSTFLGSNTHFKSGCSSLPQLILYSWDYRSSRSSKTFRRNYEEVFLVKWDSNNRIPSSHTMGNDLTMYT